MSEAACLWVISYDISRDAARARAARVLEDCGVRVQGSVFEAWLTERDLTRVLARIEKHLETNDSLRAYPLSAQAIARCRVAGAGTPPEQADFLLF